MSVTKLNISTKLTSTGKYKTFMYGAKFDNGGINISFKPEHLAALTKAIEDGDIPLDSYGYVKLSVFEQTPRDNSVPF